MKISMEELRRRLDDAVQQKFGKDTSSDYWRYYVVETFDDYVIARGAEEKLFQIPFTLDADDNVTLGDAQEVETAYVPVSQSAHFKVTAATASETDDFVYDVDVMKAGIGYGSVNGPLGDMPQLYPREVVAEVAQAVTGARFGRRHPVAPGEAEDPQRIAGWFSDGRMEGDTACGKLHLLESEKDLATKLGAARKAGQLGLFGLSIFGYLGYKPGKVDGKPGLVATRLGKLKSVDLVSEAGAGGKFRVAAGSDLKIELAQMQGRETKTSVAPTTDQSGSVQNAGRHKGAEMKDRILKLLASLRKLDAGRADELQKKVDGVAEDKLSDVLLEVSQATTDAAEAALAKSATAAEAGEVMKEIRAALDESKKIASKNLVETKLSDSKLPAPAMELVRQHLKDRVVTETEVDEEIKSVRAAFASYANVGRVGEETIIVGRESVDKVQLAVDAMMGVKAAMQDANVKAFRGLREAYIFCTGDRELRFEGGFYRVSQAIATTDFPNILANSMTKKALQDYAEVGMGGLDMVISKANISDYKTQDRVRDGYFGDLATVAEAGPYTEFVKPTDEKIQYALAKRGNILTISEETIRNDDLGRVARFPGKIARAARRTLKQFITNFFINNPAFDPDTVAFFHATHNNLLALALTSANLDTAEQNQMKQTEKDSAKRLGLPLTWLMVPIELKSTAYQINQNNEGTNQWFHRFGENNERIIVNELLTDVNDWYYGTDASNVPTIEIGYLDGVEEPQILLANLPTQGTQFTNDQIQYKVKFPFGGDIIDFRGAGKSVI
jgi:hypothetical protein